MQPYKCTVTNAKSSAPLAAAKPPVYCPNDASKCVAGAKQMIAWHQATGNNVETQNWGENPGYNEKCGFKSGRQTDIFETASGSEPQPATSAVTATSVSETETSATSVAAVTADTTPVAPTAAPVSVVTSVSTVVSVSTVTVTAETCGTGAPPPQQSGYQVS